MGIKCFPNRWNNVRTSGQDWIYTLSRNSCTAGLNVRIETAWEKLEGHHQAGVVYLWLILDVIINITDDIAAGLKSRINVFDQKGLSRMYIEMSKKCPKLVGL